MRSTFTTTTAAAALMVGFGLAAGPANADDNADTVIESNLGAGNGSANNPSLAVDDVDNTWVSLGTEGDITVGFTDNTAIDGPGDDIRIRDRCGAIEEIQVLVSVDGTNFVDLGNFDDATADFAERCSSPDFDADLDLDLSDFPDAPGGVTQVKVVDQGEADISPGAGFNGFDLENVVALNNLDLGPAHIAKALTGATEIEVGIDTEQQFQFTITINNNEGEDLTDIVFLDTVPGEFDVYDGGFVEVTAEDDVGDCDAGAFENKRGNQKLAPDFIEITADGLTVGQSCTITVDVVTDDDHPGGGNSPDFTPTSCDTGSIVLNEGVQVFRDENGDDMVDDGDTLLFQDDDSLTLSCSTS